MIEKLFTSKNRVKILEYLLFHKEETYIREISRKLKISSSAVKREIDNLLSLEIIEISDNRINLNEKCSFLIDLKNIFIKTDFIIYPIKKYLCCKNIKFALIFGSFARGEFTNDSDIDLLIIGDSSSSEIYGLADKIEKEVKRNVNPIILNLNNFKKEKNSGLVRDIFSKKIIMIKGDENELRKIIR